MVMDIMARSFKQTRLPGENLRYQGRASIFAFAVDVLKNAFWIALVYYAYRLIRPYIDHDIIYYVFQFFMLIFMAMIFSDFIQLLADELLLTDKRIIAKAGFVKRSALEMLLNKASGVVVEQSLFGRLLGYGDIAICGAGDDRVVIADIADPFTFTENFIEVMNEEHP